MRDVFIVIPGIMGSVLSKDDNVLWDPGWGMAKKLLRHKEWVESLVLEDDDPADTGWVGNVVPSALVGTKSIIPGLVNIGGYTELDAALNQAFGPKLIEGSPLEPSRRLDGLNARTAGHPNYYQFAYDWRRDNRANALRLHDLIETALSALRPRNPKVKVVILAHSMGGMIARYYMYGLNPRNGEPFEGWRNVRELFSMGTPYRGSLDSLHRLHAGFRKLFVDFSETLGSYTSAYQLLPRYPVVLAEGADPDAKDLTVDDYLYPHELGQLKGLDQARAESAYSEFHLPVDDYIEQLGKYHRIGIVPNIGFGHPTYNSARLDGGDLKLTRDVPGYLERDFGGGDGTVPMISAIPVELDGLRSTLRYTNQQHGDLQTDSRTLASEVDKRLKQSQSGTTKARNPVDETELSGLIGVSIECPQFVMAGETASMTVLAQRVDGSAVETSSKPMVEVVDLKTSTPVALREPVALGQTVTLPLDPGEYQIKVRLDELQSQTMVAVID